MATTAIIGDGPAGLSAALLLAKNGQRTIVYAQDDTLMHKAQLHNYLGIDDVSGTAFQGTAQRQARAVGAELRDEAVESLGAEGDEFVLRTVEGEQRADAVIVAGGRASRRLATGLGAQESDGAIVVDAEQRTTVPGLYAAGHVVRPERSQAIISAGAGAVAALDILSREAGKDVHDWDVPQG